jgi:hypothetical protein
MAGNNVTEIVLRAIEDQLEDSDPSELEELQLDTLQIPKFTDDIKIKLEQFTSLASLSLNGCDLRSLENFPNVSRGG